MRNGRPRAALASIGTGLNQATFSVILNLLSADMGIKQAVDGPLLHLPTWNAEIEAFTANVIEGDFSADLLDRVRMLGLDVAVHPRPGHNVSGSVIGATIDPVSGTLNAAGARGFNALPLAY
jgi:gamma-glutamyltranspeptidase